MDVSASSPTRSNPTCLVKSALGVAAYQAGYLIAAIDQVPRQQPSDGAADSDDEYLHRPLHFLAAVPTLPMMACRAAVVGGVVGAVILGVSRCVLSGSHGW